MASRDTEAFRELLDREYIWPANYRFKLIVPAASLDSLAAIVDLERCEVRASKNGNYHSITFVELMSSARSVIATYEKISAIEGAILL